MRTKNLKTALTSRTRTPLWTFGAAIGVVFVAQIIAACDDAPIPPPPARGPTAALRSGSASASAAPPPPVYTEADFTVSDQNRDPFKPYPEVVNPKPDGRGQKAGPQVKIIAEKYSLDELHLVALVTGGTNARAMFVDPAKKGHIVTRGEYVGRSEVVKSAQQGGGEYEVNWKVERIREGDVIFVRELPGASSPIATRVVALRPEGDTTLPTR